MASASADENTDQTTSYASLIVRKTRFEAMGIPVILKGFWIALVPGSMLRHDRHGVRLSRWRLGCLLDDVDQLLHDQGTGTG